MERLIEWRPTASSCCACRGPWSRGTVGAQSLTWHLENRPIGYRSSVAFAGYAYDGDGVHVKIVSKSYDAWGDIRPRPDNALPTDYALTGQHLQGETGLYQIRAR